MTLLLQSLVHLKTVLRYGLQALAQAVGLLIYAVKGGCSVVKEFLHNL